MHLAGFLSVIFTTNILGGSPSRYGKQCSNILGMNDLSKLRHRAGITQERLAELAGVSHQTVVNIEKGHLKRGPHHLTVRAIEAALWQAENERDRQRKLTV